MEYKIRYKPLLRIGSIMESIHTKSCRIGLLLEEKGGRVRSIPMNRMSPRSSSELPSEEVQEWFRDLHAGGMSADEDSSLIGYFYRCMEEGLEFYYVYYESTGWYCGGVTGDTPLRGKLLPVEEAQEVMEQWVEDLKYVLPTPVT